MTGLRGIPIIERDFIISAFLMDEKLYVPIGFNNACDRVRKLGKRKGRGNRNGNALRLVSRHFVNTFKKEMDV
jgi:hypothetical protein